MFPCFSFCQDSYAKKKRSDGLGGGKIFHKLIVPMFLMSIVTYCYYILVQYKQGTLVYSDIYMYPLWFLLGLKKAVMGMWFIYTLILCRMIYLMVPQRLWQFLIACFFLVFAYIFNKSSITDTEYSKSAILNVFVAFPFFAFGTWIKSYKDKISGIHSKKLLLIMLVFSGLIVYYCGEYNEVVWMYKCGYGDNILLFLMGGMSGTTMIFSLVKLFVRPSYSMETIARGNILILGFHGRLINFFSKTTSNLPLYIDYVSAFIIMVLFIPAILFCERFFPWLIGARHCN